MLDINLLIEERGGNPEMVRESERRRGGKVEIIDEIIAEYKEWTTRTFYYSERKFFRVPPSHIYINMTFL